LKRRALSFAASAKTDLLHLHDWIAERAGDTAATAYLDRLEAHCRGLQLFSESGHRRDDLRPGLRIVGFERRIAIAFIVEPEQVIIVRLLYGGRQFVAT
jgi:toxin ParE1/3/4